MMDLETHRFIFGSSLQSRSWYEGLKEEIEDMMNYNMEVDLIISDDARLETLQC